MQRAEEAYRTYVALGDDNSTAGLGALVNRGLFRQIVGDFDSALADLRLAVTGQARHGTSGH